MACFCRASRRCRHVHGGRDWNANLHNQARTHVKASAALGADFDRRSLIASDLHVRREANVFVTVRLCNAWGGFPTSQT
jgi:hypothetical protein